MGVEFSTVNITAPLGGRGSARARAEMRWPKKMTLRKNGVKRQGNRFWRW